MGQIAALIALYVGGIFSVAHIVGKRVDDLNKNMSLRFDDFGKHIEHRFDDFGKHVDQRFENIEHRFNDLRSQMSRGHDTLAQKVDAIDRKLDAHISNYEIPHISNYEIHRLVESD